MYMYAEKEKSIFCSSFIENSDHLSLEASEILSSEDYMYLKKAEH